MVQGAGGGYPLHRSWLSAKRANPGSEVWLVPYPETTGGSPAQADLDITWTGTATANGRATIQIAGEPRLEINVNVDDTPTIVAAAFDALVNGQAVYPVTSSVVGGTQTLLAKAFGINGGDGTTGAIRVQVDIDPGIGMTVATENGATGATLDALGSAQQRPAPTGPHPRPRSCRLLSMRR